MDEGIKEQNVGFNVDPEARGVGVGGGGVAAIVAEVTKDEIKCLRPRLHVGPLLMRLEYLMSIRVVRQRTTEGAIALQHLLKASVCMFVCVFDDRTTVAMNLLSRYLTCL